MNSTYYQHNEPELLAPVGGMENLHAAVQNGCNAVYLGGKAFGARAYAQNFGREEIQEAVQYAHFFGVRVYVTVNILYKDEELAFLLEFVRELYADGVDGVIMQDIGAAQLIRQVFPDLEVHASTQMTIHNIEGVQYLEEMGLVRVVLARELTLEEIRQIIENSSVEIETFIHGALCICYSGQCLMSSLIGGRSGNRGRCAQTCRLPYRLIDRETNKVVTTYEEPQYLMSPKDINTLEILPQLIHAGIHSFKMEGRMKRPEYAAAVTRIYRKYINLALQDPGNYRVDSKDMEEITQVFNRGGFSTGYYHGKSGSRMMSYTRPKNWGVKIGEVVSYDARRNLCKIRLQGDLKEGDGIEIWTEHDENPGTQVHSLRRLEDDLISVPIKGKISAQNPVYRTSQKELLNELVSTYVNNKRKIDLFGQIRLQVGEKMDLHLWDQAGNYVQVESEEIVERAQKQPVTEKKVQEQLSKLGNEPYQLVEVNVEMESNIFVPISKLNALRRKAVEQLTETRIRQFGGSRVEKDIPANILTVSKAELITEKELAVYLNANHFQAEKFIQLGIQRLYLNISQVTIGNLEKFKEMDSQLKIYAVLPRISCNSQMLGLKEKIKTLLASSLDGFILGNLGQVKMLHDLGNEKAWILDYPMNLFNRLTLDYWAKAGATGGVISPELNLKEITELVQWSSLKKEVIGYGYLPTMTTEYCPVGALKGGMTTERGCSSKGSSTQYGLLDRKGMVFPILTDCQTCRSVLLNSQPLFILEQLDHILQADFQILRMDLTIEEEEAALQMVQAYQERLENSHQPIPTDLRALINQMRQTGFTKGHFYRGVE